jgi:hypothetical protein
MLTYFTFFSLIICFLSRILTAYSRLFERSLAATTYESGEEGEIKKKLVTFLKLNKILFIISKKSK